MIETACAMLDKVYQEQYNKVCSYINEKIEDAAHHNNTEVSLMTSDWVDECPLITTSSLIDELTMKGYTTDVSTSLLTISWEGAEKLCRVRPYQTTHTKVTADTTIGSFTL